MDPMPRSNSSYSTAHEINLNRSTNIELYIEELITLIEQIAKGRYVTPEDVKVGLASLKGYLDMLKRDFYIPIQLRDTIAKIPEVLSPENFKKLGLSLYDDMVDINDNINEGVAENLKGGTRERKLKRKQKLKHKSKKLTRRRRYLQKV